MEKTVSVSLNNYPEIPNSLRIGPGQNIAVGTLDVDLAGLYHHYYLDVYGIKPPSPDPTSFEYVNFLLSNSEFRFQGDGLGDSPSAKRNRSNDLGQAFCRWFLCKHLGIVYFAHIAKILNRQRSNAIPGLRVSVERQAYGDTPDYFCAANVNNVFLAEAKGRYSSIGFQTKEFAKWRKQFDRVIVRDSNNRLVSVKGHIVATRFATESAGPRVQSCIYAEDPSTRGESHIDGEGSAALAAAVRGIHYAEISVKLRQPILAAALQNGLQMAEQLRVQGIVWELVEGPLRGRRFVGGYFPGLEGDLMWQKGKDGKPEYLRSNQLRLDSPSATFFGLEEGIFAQIVGLARGPTFQAGRMEQFRETQFFYSAVSILPDGTALGPIEWFRPVEPIDL